MPRGPFLHDIQVHLKIALRRLPEKLIVGVPDPPRRERWHVEQIGDEEEKRPLQHGVFLGVDALRLGLEHVVFEFVRAIRRNDYQIEEILVLQSLVSETLLVLIVFAHPIEFICVDPMAENIIKLENLKNAPIVDIVLQKELIQIWCISVNLVDRLDKFRG